MGSWTDANLRNHISGDRPQLTFNNFFEHFNFVNELSTKYSPFILKDLNFTSSNIQYNAINSEKFDKHTSNLKERSPQFSFAATSNNKPMMDAYFAFNNVYLYQLILKLNNLWNIMEYTDSSIKKIIIPRRAHLQRLLKDLLTDNYFKSVKELTTPEAIAEAIENVIIKADIDLGMEDVIVEKLYLSNLNEIKARVKSPLVAKYLSRELSKLIYKVDAENDNLLAETLDDILKKLKIYVYSNQ